MRASLARPDPCARSLRRETAERSDEGIAIWIAALISHQRSLCSLCSPVILAFDSIFNPLADLFPCSVPWVCGWGTCFAPGGSHGKFASAGFGAEANRARVAHLAELGCGATPQRRLRPNRSALFVRARAGNADARSAGVSAAPTTRLEIGDATARRRAQKF